MVCEYVEFDSIIPFILQYEEINIKTAAINPAELQAKKNAQLGQFLYDIIIPFRQFVTNS